LSGSETKTDTGGTGKTQRSEGWQGARVGAVSAKMLLVFVLARKRRSDLVTVRAVAERRPPKRSEVETKDAHHATLLTYSRSDMGKVVLLTGAPGVGKSTLRGALAKRLSGLQAFDYGMLLLKRKKGHGITIPYSELREKSSAIVTPADVGSVDDWVIGRVSELRQHSDVVLDSHALTAEQYGLRAIPFSADQLRQLKLDAVLVLRCEPATLLKRIHDKPEG